MHSEISFVVQQRIFDLFGEKSFSFQLVERKLHQVRFFLVRQHTGFTQCSSQYHAMYAGLELCFQVLLKENEVQPVVGGELGGQCGENSLPLNHMRG